MEKLRDNSANPASSLIANRRLLDRCALDRCKWDMIKRAPIRLLSREMARRVCSELLGGKQVQVAGKLERHAICLSRNHLNSARKNWFGIGFAIQENRLSPLFLGVELVCNVTPRTVISEVRSELSPIGNIVRFDS